MFIYRFFWSICDCDQNSGAGAVNSLIIDNKTDVIVGPACSARMLSCPSKFELWNEECNFSGTFRRSECSILQCANFYVGRCICHWNHKSWQLSNYGKYECCWVNSFLKVNKLSTKIWFYTHSAKISRFHARKIKNFNFSTTLRKLSKNKNFCIKICLKIFPIFHNSGLCQKFWWFRCRSDFSGPDNSWSFSKFPVGAQSLEHMLLKTLIKI